VSRAGQSDVTLEFLWGTDMDLAASTCARSSTHCSCARGQAPLLLRFDPTSEPVLRLAFLDKEARTMTATSIA